MAVVSEHPPIDIYTQRRIDIVGKQGKLDFFYLEAKKGKATENDLRAVESQAFDACNEHFVFTEGRKTMWAMTCFGPCIRIWTVSEKGGMLMPYFPEEGEGKSAYIDIANNHRQLSKIFKYMKRNVVPPMTERMQDDQDLGGPSYRGPSYSENGMIIVEDSFIFITMQKAQTDGRQIGTSAEGEDVNLRFDHWAGAQVLLEGGYKLCYAQRQPETGRWFWAWYEAS